MDLKRFLIIPVFFTSAIVLFGQESFKDTLRISVRQADSTFISQNLSLLAEKCNIEASRAQIIQARLFKNLTFSIEQNVYNTEYLTNGGRPWFDFTDKGETSVQIQKLFLLAGKRNKLIQLAESGALREEQVYFDMLRTLKYSLHSQFYNIYFLQQILKVYDKEISSLDRLVGVFEGQSEKGFISRKELLRIKSMLFSLENEKLGLTTQMISAQSDFNILMHTSNLYYLTQFDQNEFDKRSLDSLKLSTLIDTADIYRYDLRMARTDLDISNINLAYQKSVAVPDLTLSGGWDRNGSYVHNYNFIGMQFDLPFFDRNQGNIKTAKFNAESNKYKVQSAEDQVKADVINAYSTAIETDRLYSRFDKSFLGDLESMNGEMLKNFEKRNISLIEFLDYYDAYKTNVIQLNTLMYNLINSFENINFVVGKDILTK
ncbi:MAG: TolC family protein [Bacteroidales bacterium]|jgi:cobalt-zinc-cadmium efflux system outer membrane protein